MNPFSAIGLLINSALYLVSIVAVAIATGNKPAACLAITTMGVNYLAYFLQSRAERDTVNIAAYNRVMIGVRVAVILSILLGAAAGVALLVR